ncbi:response regulator transcription factor [Petralouisia muris]|uniref:Response regulator transcription factor n=1 Tax=Petralouisia muris TaxID=3032872 RepID=A0AC61RVD1_9FIRM|nr:response regulator transcription factor [Petralouisia muris]TGY95883.1 response regulator transcription factor [Petralouisia muris]
MKKILAADDEQDIRNLLKESLEMEGYLVYTAKNGMEAMEGLKHQPDLIILDVNMPDLDGYTVCEKIRDYVDCPILFLTARTEEQDRVNGFKAGGDDYIVKPFGMDELLARVEAHLRREARRQQSGSVYIKGDLTVDFSGRQVLLKGEDAGLTKTEFSIVELLISHSGQVFEKEQIYERVRGFDGEADPSIIAEHVRRIRQKIDGETKHIETVWGVGYKWIG